MHNSSEDLLHFDNAWTSFYCHKSTWIGQVVTTRKFPSLNVLHSALDQYIVSFYLTAVTLACTGYGDVAAELPMEMFVASIAQVVGTLYFSFILGDISASLQAQDIHRGHYKCKLSDIQKFFRVYRVAEETQQQVCTRNFSCIV